MAGLFIAVIPLSGCGGSGRGSDAGGLSTGGLTTGSTTGISTTGSSTGSLTTGSTTSSSITTGSTGTPVTTGSSGTGSPGILPSGEGRFYRGTATIKVSTLDARGNVNDPRSYATSIQIRIANPLQVRGNTETNPVSIAVESDPGIGAKQAGGLQLYSARSVTDTYTGRDFLYQYWSIQQSGNNVTGSLVQTHVGEDQVSNQINVPADVSNGVLLPWGSFMNEGTQLTGTVTDNQISLHLQGQLTSIKTFHPFTMEITATR